MNIPLKYTIHNLYSRRFSSIMAISGITLVVFIFTAVLMMAYGVEKTLITTGSPDNVLIVRKGSPREFQSMIDRESCNLIRTLPYMAKMSDGRPILSEELVAVITMSKIDSSSCYVTIRGVSLAVMHLRPQVKIIQGKMFNPSLKELIVGSSVAIRFKDAQMGNTVQFAGDKWKVVGIFSSNGSGFDSEIWADTVQLQDTLNRGSSVSSTTFKLNDPSSFRLFRAAFESDRRLQKFEAKIEQDFFAEKSAFLEVFIKTIGLFVTLIFSIGAMVGAMITMYSAVANRTVEIGTMRALGFSRRNILIAFLVESESIALAGGGAGILLALFLQFFSISTLNYQTWSDISFSFALSPAIIILSLIFTAMMGLIGGFLPSIRAARVPIVEALRGG
jgi:putative ABC transport system permease protein